MALKEQANKKGSPRNNNDRSRDGKPLEKNVRQYEERVISEEDIFKQE